MTRPRQTYSLTLAQIEDLAHAISELDHIKKLLLTNASDPLAAVVDKAHCALMDALGPDAHLVYAPRDY